MRAHVGEPIVISAPDVGGRRRCGDVVEVVSSRAPDASVEDDAEDPA